MSAFQIVTDYPDHLPPLPLCDGDKIIYNIPKPVVKGGREKSGSLKRAVVTWNVPEVPETNIESFEVYWYEERGFNKCWQKVDKGFFSSIRTVDIGMPPDHRYYFIVRAKYVTDIWGPFSDPVYVDL